MSEGTGISAGAWRGFLAVLVFLLAIPALADTRVVFSPLTDGPDFEAAMEFFADHFKEDPETYTSKVPVEAPGDARALNKSLGLYLRKVVRVGKGDINGDGVEERFYFMAGADPFTWCGSMGCAIFIVQRQPSGWKLMCEISGGEHGIWITDRITVRGYRELQASFRVYWNGDRCDSDIPSVRDIRGMPAPDPLRAPEK